MLQKLHLFWRRIWMYIAAIGVAFGMSAATVFAIEFGYYAQIYGNTETPFLIGLFRNYTTILRVIDGTVYIGPGLTWASPECQGAADCIDSTQPFLRPIFAFGHSRIIIKPGSTFSIDDSVLAGLDTPLPIYLGENASLVAEGTETQPIVIQRAPGSTGRGVYIHAVGSAQVTLRHTTLSGLGATKTVFSPMPCDNTVGEDIKDAALSLRNTSSAILDHVTITQSRGLGMYFGSGTSADTGYSVVGTQNPLDVVIDSGSMPFTDDGDRLLQAGATAGILIDTGSGSGDARYLFRCVETVPTFAATAEIATTVGEEHNSATVPARVTLTLSMPLPADYDALTIPITFSDDTATAGQDYTIPTETAITILPGEQSGSMVIPVHNDHILENTENITVVFGEPSNSNVVMENDRATVSIEDHTTAGGTITVDHAGSEGGDVITGTLTLTETNGTGHPLEIPLTFSGAALRGTDFTVDAQVSIPDGSATGTFTITVIDDAVFDGTESITITADAEGATHKIISGGIVGTTMITDNDTASLTLYGAPGAESGPTPIHITATLSAINYTAAPIVLTVGYANGTATIGTDFMTSAAGTITIPVGASSAAIDLPVVDDMLWEPHETATATVTAADNAAVTITGATTELRITDNEVVLASLAATTDGAENGPTSIVYTMTLSATNTSGAPITFNTAITGGTASSEDITGSVVGQHTITIASGASTGTFIMPVVDDTAIEEVETVTVTASQPSATAVTIAVASADGRIIDNDVASASNDDDGDKKKKKKKHAAVVAPIARAVAPLTTPHTDVVTPAEVPVTPDVTWDRATSPAAQRPAILGVTTAQDEGSSRFPWHILILLLLLLLLLIIIYAIVRYVRHRDDNADAHEQYAQRDPYDPYDV